MGTCCKCLSQNFTIVNIGSDNDFVPSGIKPLPERVLAQIYDKINIMGPQSAKQHSRARKGPIYSVFIKTEESTMTNFDSKI